MPENRKLRIAIDTRFNTPHQGIGTALLAMANALSKSGNTEQEYTFIVLEELREWLQPHIFGPCRLVCIPPARVSGLRRRLRAIKPLHAVWARILSRRIPTSSGLVESQGFDLVHFPTQSGYLTQLPSIYQPWDLQHLHYPQFFSKQEFAERERLYRTFCTEAAFVCVQAEWSKRDVVEKYGVAPEKVVVIPWGSVFDSYATPSPELRQSAIQKYKLPEQFFFYPAVTWPHKNHECIIRALRILKSQHGRSPEVFFTGASTAFRKKLDEMAKESGVLTQLHYLGFIPPGDLQSVFASATAMLFPSKFEGFGLPVLEAFHSRVPVLSSNATVLPEVAQDGAAYFNPDDPSELATLMLRALDDADFRASLIEKGSKVLASFSMRDTVAAFQSLYARVAGQRVKTSDQAENIGASKKVRA